jgi:hypothetical protein
VRLYTTTKWTVPLCVRQYFNNACSWLLALFVEAFEDVVALPAAVLLAGAELGGQTEVLGLFPRADAYVAPRSCQFSASLHPQLLNPRAARPDRVLDHCVADPTTTHPPQAMSRAIAPGRGCSWPRTIPALRTPVLSGGTSEPASSLQRRQRLAGRVRSVLSAGDLIVALEHLLEGSLLVRREAANLPADAAEPTGVCARSVPAPCAATSVTAPTQPTCRAQPRIRASFLVTPTRAPACAVTARYRQTTVLIFIGWLQFWVVAPHRGASRPMARTRAA